VYKKDKIRKPIHINFRSILSDLILEVLFDLILDIKAVVYDVENQSRKPETGGTF